MIWRQALGWDEVTVDEDGNRRTVKHPPVAWCQQFLYERVEGKAPLAVQDETVRISAAEKVRDLSKQRLNKLAAVSAMPAMPRKEKETNGSAKEE